MENETRAHRLAGRRPLARRNASIPAAAPGRGFTLIELALVAVIVSILMVAAIPGLRRTADRLRAEQGMAQLAQLLRAAHEQAVVEQGERVWSWDERARRARVGIAGTDDPDAPGPTTIEGSPLPPEASVSIIRDGSPVGCRCVRFFPEGTSEPTTITISLHAQTYSATVDAATGRILTGAVAH